MTHKTSSLHITAVLLAAGLSRRMGKQNKLLLVIDGKPMVSKVLDELGKTSVDQIVVVVGHEADLIRPLVKDFARISVVKNPAYDQGMSTSLVTGVSQSRQSDGILICLADMPYLLSTDYERIIDAFRDRGDTGRIVVPKFENRSGNPVLFGKKYIPELLKLVPEDSGARQILQSHHHEIIFLPMDNDHILRDIDVLP